MSSGILPGTPMKLSKLLLAGIVGTTWGLIEARQQEQSIPLGRVGQPQDIANAALFLASDDASFATGASFVIDGGELLSGS